MARSSYIYVLYGPDATIPLGAFTVKHEMLTFIEHYGQPVFARRYRDGRPADGWSHMHLIEADLP
jgi:hypothetical protein